MDEKNFFAALKKLDSNASMRLWKQFQKSEGHKRKTTTVLSLVELVL